MRRRAAVPLLLTPSILSGSFVVGASAVLVVSGAWSYVRYRQLFYEYLFGPYGIQTALVQAPDSFSFLRMAILNNSINYYLSVVVGGVIVGLVVYAVLDIVQTSAKDSATILHDIEEHHLKGESREILGRLVARIIAIVGWLGYGLLFVNVLTPFAMVLLETGIGELAANAVHGWGSILSAFVLLVITLHMHIIFLRLSLLRPRLFSYDYYS